MSDITTRTASHTRPSPVACNVQGRWAHVYRCRLRRWRVSFVGTPTETAPLPLVESERLGFPSTKALCVMDGTASPITNGDDENSRGWFDQRLNFVPFLFHGPTERLFD